MAIECVDPDFICPGRIVPAADPGFGPIRIVAGGIGEIVRAAGADVADESGLVDAFHAGDASQPDFSPEVHGDL